MNEPLGIALELAAKRRAFARRLSPLARRMAFPALHRIEAEHRREVKQRIARIENDWSTGKRVAAREKALAVEPQATVIVDVCAACWGVPAGQIYDAVRKAIYARPRQAAMALMREHLQLTLPTIGVILRRDHTTVIYGLQTHEDRIETDADYRAKYDAAEAEVRELIQGNGVTSDTTPASGEADGVTEPPSRTPLAIHRRAA